MRTKQPNIAIISTDQFPADSVGLTAGSPVTTRDLYQVAD